jgi:hypothetical protein|tara:strand:- start:68 stop:316 length:249 start_codon:yes stop_codon:yes gene_type:complete
VIASEPGYDESMKNLTVPISIIVGAIIISISIFFAVTHDKRVKFNICMNTLFYSKATNLSSTKYKEIEKDSKFVCKNEVYYN